MKSTIKYVPFLLLLSHTFFSLSGCESLKSSFQSIIQPYKNHHAALGVMAVGLSGKICASHSQGKCGDNKECSLETAFPIGSLSKQMTAAALLRAILDKYDGNLALMQEALHRPIIHFLGDSHEVWSQVPERKAPLWSHQVTPHHLLSNTSGLKDIDIPTFTALGKKSPHTRASMAKMYNDINSSLKFSPGTQYEYSNPNFFFAAVLIESLTGKNLSLYLKEKFFDPAEMKETFLPLAGTPPSLISNHPHMALGFSYSFKSNLVTPITDYWPADIDFGASAIISTASDLIRWNHVLFETEIFFPKKVSKLMTTPISLHEGSNNYGYGLEILQGKTASLYTHDGLIPGGHTTLFYDVETKQTWVHLTNISPDLNEYLDIIQRQEELQQDTTQSSEHDEKELSLKKDYPMAEEQYEFYRLATPQDVL